MVLALSPPTFKNQERAPDNLYCQLFNHLLRFASTLKKFSGVDLAHVNNPG
jgi:hypothetical protein